jgi:hypothetical protein
MTRPEILEYALIGYECQRAHIVAEMERLRAELNGSGAAHRVDTSSRKGRMTPQARRKMRRLLLARWRRARAAGRRTLR